MSLIRIVSRALVLTNFVRRSFYYADERTESGFAAFRDVSGPAHAEHFLTLAESKESLPWLQTFVGGKGYVDFANI